MWKKIALLGALMAFSSHSYAFVDMEYYTYGTFQETVDAFKRAALFFNLSTSPLQSLVFAFFGAGLVAAVLVSGYTATSNALNGQSGSKMPIFLFTTILGAGIVSVTVAPKNTVHVYDQTYNKYESVGGVPSIIVFAAGVSNMIGELYRDHLSTSTAYPIGELMSGTPFQILQNATASPSTFYSSYLMQSLGNYYLDCAPTANSLGKFDLDQLVSGTSSITDELSKMKHNTIYTTYYDSTTPSGDYVSCKTSFDRIKTKLNNPATFKRHFDEICSQLHLDPNNAVEAATCRGKIESIFQTAYNVAGSNYMVSLQNVLAAAAIESAIETGNVEDAIKIQANRTQMAEAIGGWTIAYEYIPTIKGMLFVMILASSPFLILAMTTPLMPVALKTYFSLFAFYLLWDILDSSIVYMVEDQFMAVMSDLQSSKMGLMSMWSSPSASMKGLTILAQQRSAAITMATLIAVSLFKINAYAAAGIAQKSEGNLEKTGEDLGKDYSIQENAGHRMTEMATGNANLQTLRNTGGQDGYIAGTSANSSVNVRGGQILAENQSINSAAHGSAYHQMESGHTSERLSGEFGGIDKAAMALGNANATRQSAQAIATNTSPDAKEKLIASESHNLGQGQGYIDAKRETGKSIEEMGAYSTSTNAVKDMAEKTTLQQNGVDALDAHGTQGALSAAQKAGDKRYHDNSPQSAYDNVAEGTYNRHVQESSNVEAIRNLAPNAETYYQGTETKNVSDDIAHYDMREQLAETFGVGDVEVARMLSGNQRLNLTQDQVQAGYDAGFIKEDAYQLGMKNDGLAFESDMIIDNGQLQTNKSVGMAGDSTSYDATQTVDSSQTHRTGTSVTDEHHFSTGYTYENPYAVMQDADILKAIYANESLKANSLGEQQQAITQEYTKLASDGVQGMFGQTKNNMSMDTKSASAQLEWDSGESGLGSFIEKITGGSAKANVSYDKSNQDSLENTMDTFRSQYLNPAHNMIWERVEHELETGQITQEQFGERFSSYVSSHNQFLAEVGDGVRANPMDQVGAQPWQNSPMGFFHEWENSKFGDTSFKEEDKDNSNSGGNEPNHKNQEERAMAFYNGSYGITKGGYGSGNFINEPKDNDEPFKHKARLYHEQGSTGNMAKPPMPTGDYAWGTRELPKSNVEKIDKNS